MPELAAESGLVEINDARIYYQQAGQGQPLVMIHAGVADHRQWNHEFAYFAGRFRVLRYDMRGYGQSEPVEGEYSHLQDLTALLDRLGYSLPLILMGCSMGGGLAIDFALAYPSRVKALILVGSAPSGLKLDVPEVSKFAEVEQAYDAGELDLAAELETQIWFDGAGRDPSQVDQTMRRLAYEMNRTALAHEAKGLGKLLPAPSVPAVERLNELNAPVLIVVGARDTPYILAAAEYLMARLPNARRVTMQDAAHLPNMDHPDRFRRIVSRFLNVVNARQAGSQ